jgi:hypothetical protein
MQHVLSRYIGILLTPPTTKVAKEFAFIIGEGIKINYKITSVSKYIL